MGLFDLFKRKPADQTQWRDHLFEAAGRQDWQSVANFCRQHDNEIRELFAVWQRDIPERIVNDPVALNRYGDALMAIAQIFARARDRSLIDSLMGDPAENPVSQWQEDLTTAQSLIDSQKPAEAIDLLQSVLARTAELKGSAVDFYLPRTHGILALAYSRNGDTARATEHTQQARDLCDESGDADGVSIYESNLQFLKDGRGVFFHDEQGRTISLHELKNTSGAARRIQFEAVSNRPVPPDADALHKQARKAGEAGDYAAALAGLKRASELAPDWPYPVYDMAMTFLLMKDAESAEACYRKTVELSPRGFFTAITAVDTLQREREGDLPAGTYLAYLSLEQIEPREARAEAARRLAKRIPTFAPAWKEIAALSRDKTEKLHAADMAFAAHPDAETRGIMLINQAMNLINDGEHAAGRERLQELANDPASTLATEELAKAMLQMISGK